MKWESINLWSKHLFGVCSTGAWTIRARWDRTRALSRLLHRCMDDSEYEDGYCLPHEFAPRVRG